MSHSCIVLFSGGLDSTLALRLMTAQGVEATAMYGVNCFHGAEDLEAKKNTLRRRALELGARDVLFPDMTAEVIAVTKNPKYGRGKNYNACIDCRLRTVAAGFRFMRELGADFVVNGEVIGQRPMSQRPGALAITDREVAKMGFEGLLLRPLCAKRLPPTVPELKEWVDREKLFGFCGRGRNEQMALAAELGITEYPSPAGGCLLTDPGYAFRLKNMADNQPDWNREDAELLKLGRHFRINSETLAVASRNGEENDKICALARDSDYFYITSEKPGAVVLLRGRLDDESERMAAGLSVHYSKHRQEGLTRVTRWRGKDEADKTEISAFVVSPGSMKDYYVGLDFPFSNS